MRRLLPLLIICVALVTAVAAPAGAATSLVIRGAGYGHGVGMSQFGTLGYARHGWTAPAILGHYFTGTKLARLTDSPTIRVLLQSGPSSYRISGAAAVNDRMLDPTKMYTVSLTATGVVIRAQGSDTGLAGASPLIVSPPAGGALTLGGPAQNGLIGGRYRGTLEFSPAAAGGGLQAVNAVGLENYVAGVIAAEIPASWPREALRVQAIAARTYAITTNKQGAGFDQYADTRSQMYRGVSAETLPTLAATQATAGQVVTYAGKPVVTYFFSSSGGRTENVENSFIGSDPQPWLKSVADPYDTVSPYHRWGPTSMTLGRATLNLGTLVDGRLQSIKVLRRGVSPRIVRARLIGSTGTTSVTGPQLRKALGLKDAWMRFTTFSTQVSRGGGGSGRSGGTAAQARAAQLGGVPAARPVLHGTVAPATAGAWASVERRGTGRWTGVADVQLGAGGAYRVALPGPGSYRVRYGDAIGPVVVSR